MQIAVPFVLPMFCVVALASLLKLDHPLLGYSLGPLELAGGIAVGYCLRFAARAAASASARPVPRWLYGLAGLCFLALTVMFARLSYGDSSGSGNEAASITLAFLALYCGIGGGLSLGRALASGPKRKIFWVFLPRWLTSAR